MIFSFKKKKRDYTNSELLCTDIPGDENYDSSTEDGRMQVVCKSLHNHIVLHICPASQIAISLQSFTYKNISPKT